MNAKTSLKCKSGEIITGHINPEIVFKRALVLASKLSTKGKKPAAKKLGKLHFRTASLDLIYKISSLNNLHGSLLDPGSKEKGKGLW
jgi:hypothetical protein